MEYLYLLYLFIGVMLVNLFYQPYVSAADIVLRKNPVRRGTIHICRVWIASKGVLSILVLSYSPNSRRIIDQVSVVVKT